jgi:putative ABC transport system substrate-binding protein
MLLLAGCALTPFVPLRPKPLPKVGILCVVCPPTFDGPAPPGPNVAAFVEELRVLGHVDGQTVRLVWRGAGGQNERLAGLADELVAERVDVLVSAGASPPTAAAKQATATIPIVFIGVGDPVSSGFVASYSHPGGNLTGKSNFSPETVGKRLEQLKAVAPSVARIGGLYNFANPATAREWQDAQEAAGRLGLMLEPWDVRSFADVETAFQKATSTPPDGLLVAGEPFLFLNRQRLLELVAERRLPASYNVRDWATDGGLISYGFNLTEQYRGAAVYVDKILRGAKPADLPVELPTRFDFVVNLKTARALGLTIPQTVLQQATEVIE